MTEQLTVAPWPDPISQAGGHDPRSWYVETFWLPTLGPTCTLLMRHIAERFDAEPSGFSLPLLDLAGAIGLGSRIGAGAPLRKALQRLVQFNLARPAGAGADTGAGADAGAVIHASPVLAIRRTMPGLNPRHLGRLPEPLRNRHHDWQAGAGVPAAVPDDRRARRLAFVMLEEGDDAPAVERTLLQAGVPPAIARSATRWAVDRHRAARAAAQALRAGAPAS